MSRKHRQRADGRPVTRRYVRNLVQRARDDILRAIVNGQPLPLDELSAEEIRRRVQEAPR